MYLERKNDIKAGMSNRVSRHVRRALGGTLRGFAHPMADASPSRRLGPCSLFVGAAAVLCTTMTFAQERATGRSPGDDQEGLSEIIVQAQRRSENLQDVPIAVTAVTADSLLQNNVTSMRELGIVAPSFLYGDFGTYSYHTLRGIGTPANGPGIESPVATYVDGVYQAAMIAGTIDFNNVESVEVINGPQGTLFGRNATAGLIQIRTKDPSHVFSGNASVGYGDYQTATATAYVTGEISERVAADIAIAIRNQGQGFGRNLETGHKMDYNNYDAVRTKWLINVSDALTVKLAGDFIYQDNPYAAQTPPGAIPAGSTTPIGLPPHYSDGPVDPFAISAQGGLAMTVSYDFGPVLLNSISAYRATRFHTEIGGSQIADPLYTVDTPIHEPHTQASQEFQLTSRPGSSLTWTAGFYYFHENSAWSPVHVNGGYTLLYTPVAAGGNPLLDQQFNIHNRTESGALYAQATREILEDTNLTLGARYTVEHRAFTQAFDIVDSVFGPITGAASAAATFKAPTWRVALDHKLSDDVLGYVSYNRGFKSGEFDPTGSPVHAVSPEKLDAYEVGLKSEALDHRLRVNTSAFFYKYRNIQGTSFINGLQALYNAAAAQLYGLDMDAEARVTSQLRLNLGLALLHSKFTDFPSTPGAYPNPNTDPSIPPGGNLFVPGGVDATGNRLPHAPAAVANFGGTYSFPAWGGSHFDLTAAYSFNSGYFTEADNRLRQPAFSILNLSTQWVSAGDKFSLKLWANNVTNTDYWAHAATSPTNDAVEYGPPRTYGITAYYNGL
jgi:iron complex outermembrane recepter protein